MSIFTAVFDWFKDKTETNNPTKQNPRRPATRDLTDNLQINGTLTRQLYHNSYPGIKLAGAMAFTPIAVPVWFMGLPVPISEDETIQEIINNILEEKSRQLSQIHLQCHREGTIWIYPFYSSAENKVLWEFIPDDIVSDIIRDIDSGQIISIITDEQITVTTGYNKTANVRRKRTFTQTKVETRWVGDTLPSQLKDKIQRNVTGIIPIPFSNNSDGDEIRGHSDYERILTDLKDYHDIDLKRSKMLAKFDAKMVQYTQNVNEWKANNGVDGLDEINIATTDLILNLTDKEKTEFIFPEKAHEAYDSGLKNKFRKIVEGSGIPEIFWGTKVEGNHASAQEQMDTVIKFIEDKRSQKNESYYNLFYATIKLEKMANIQSQTEYDLKIEWNALDAVSENIKSEIFLNFSRGVNSLITSAGASKDQLFKLWRYMYPSATEDDYEKFIEGLSEMALHKSFSNASYDMATDFSSGQPRTDEAQENINRLKELKQDLIIEKKDDNGHSGNGHTEQPLNIIVNTPPAEIEIPKNEITVNNPENKPIVAVVEKAKTNKSYKLIRDEKGRIIGMDVSDGNI